MSHNKNTKSYNNVFPQFCFHNKQIFINFTVFEGLNIKKDEDVCAEISKNKKQNSANSVYE